MDLSGLIFVGLAVCWAGYLIPKALAHHDEMARSRSVDDFSHKLRVLHRRGGAVETLESSPELSDADQGLSVKPTRAQRRQARRAVRAARPIATPAHQVPQVSRASAAVAARRRRRVLAVLTVALLGVAASAYFHVVPAWSVAVPVAMIVVFLVIARISVRRTTRRVVSRPQPTAVQSAEVSSYEPAEPGDAEDTVGVSRAELDAALSGGPGGLADPAAAEGSLWDPLPVTLPTYVGKARARRTVRTIEFNAEVTSSARNEADSALVREAEAAEAAAKQAGQHSGVLPETAPKAAGA